jgi:hypothetical protein
MNDVGLRVDIAHCCLDGIVPRHVLQRKRSAYSPASEGRCGVAHGARHPGGLESSFALHQAGLSRTRGIEMDAISHEPQLLVARQGSSGPVRRSMLGLGWLTHLLQLSVALRRCDYPMLAEFDQMAQLLVQKGGIRSKTH